ncbi:MAG: undecaprenyl-diphosphate phosphatase [Clostridiales bacterium]|nr:undecaprenyl-diphosphate phosphatase [Clostridiales bacterium]
MLSAWEAILLGLLQGLTEFLPVSSSGHLVIAQHFLGIEQPMLAFDIAVHLGTLAAVIAAFWGDVKALLKKPFCKTTLLLITGTIPAVAAALLLEDHIDAMFSSMTAVAMALIFTGILLQNSDNFRGRGRMEDMSQKNALIVGLFQAAAIVPGLSRSGATIFGSLFGGLDRAQAARFSFLLSIPVILGAACKQLLNMRHTAEFSLHWTYLLGAAVAALAGYAAIRIFLKLLGKRSLRYFGYYCWALAALVTVAGLLGR